MRKSRNLLPKTSALKFINFSTLFPLWSIDYVLLLLLVQLQMLCQCSSRQIPGLVSISNKNITAFNNRNLTIECFVDLSNRSSEEASFSTNGRMVLTFMTIPRETKPLHQIQSFLHCFDPNRTRCRAEFNFDLSCLEDQMDRNYFNHPNYIVEAACQVDDAKVCSPHWMTKFPFDCYDLGRIKVINAPKLGERCLYLSDNRTLECGENQYCSDNYGICFCTKGYIESNRRCVVNEWLTPSSMVTELTSATQADTVAVATSTPMTASSKGTFKALVIFLLVLAILLCIALGIVIIWSRHYRQLLEEIGG